MAEGRPRRLSATPIVGNAASEGVGATMGSVMSEVVGGGVSNLGDGK